MPKPATPAFHVEMAPLDSITPYARNPRKISEAAIEKVMVSLRENGWQQVIDVDKHRVIIAGHTRQIAAQRLGWTHAPVHIASELTPTQVKAYRLTDNRSADEAEWDYALAALELHELKADGFDLALTGFDADELAAILSPPTALLDDADVDDVPEPPAVPITVRGDVITLGRHRLMCGDCRDFTDVQTLLAGARINVAVTSPPYAAQREYDAASGFKPIAPDEYVEWYRDVATNIMAHLAENGSYFCNIKEHCDDGQRSLYVTDLLIAHVREWGWRWVDTFCWRDTKNGVPGGWANRFKDAWEPVYHYAREGAIRMNPLANGIQSDALFASGSRAKSRTGSGLLGRSNEYHDGMARPSNVLEIAAASASDHSAAYPVALPLWFIRAFSDAGDVIFDPFMGSGTTLIAAEKEARIAYGMEISPSYCDVIVARWEKATGQKATRPYA